MNDIVRTTGRGMTRALQEAIDGCASRNLTAAAFEEHGRAGGPLAPLYAALALELRLADLREQDMLGHLAAEIQADLDAMIPPPPPASGPAMFFDPDTRELRPLE